MIYEINHIRPAGVSLFFNTNSLMDRYYHTFSSVSLKMVSNKCSIIGNHFSDIKGYYINAIAS